MLKWKELNHRKIQKTQMEEAMKVFRTLPVLQEGEKILPSYTSTSYGHAEVFCP